MIAMFRRYTLPSQLRWLFVGLATLLIYVPPAAAQQRESAAKEATPWTRPNHVNDPMFGAPGRRWDAIRECGSR
jgi:hypothetical protein